MDVLSQLPREVFDIIIGKAVSYGSSVFAATILVSKHFRDAAFEELKKVRLDDYPRDGSQPLYLQQLLEKLFARHLKLEKVEINCPFYMNDAAALVFVGRGANLKELVLWECRKMTHVVGFRNIATSCRNLTTLQICGSSISDAGLNSFASYCTHLVSLRLNRCRYLTDAGLRAILIGCQSLSYIDISENIKIRGKAFDGGVGTNLKHIKGERLCLDDDKVGSLLSGRGVEKLILPRIKFSGCSGDQTASPGLSSIASDTLRELNLKHSGHHLTAGYLATIVTGCPRLKKLNISDCPCLLGQSFHSIATLQELRVLCATRMKIEDVQLKDLQNGCAGLQALYISMDAAGLSREAIAEFESARPGVSLYRDGEEPEEEEVLEFRP